MATLEALRAQCEALEQGSGVATWYAAVRTLAVLRVQGVSIPPDEEARFLKLLFRKGPPWLHAVMTGQPIEGCPPGVPGPSPLEVLASEARGEELHTARSLAFGLSLVGTPLAPEPSQVACLGWQLQVPASGRWMTSGEGTLEVDVLTSTGRAILLRPDGHLTQGDLDGLAALLESKRLHSVVLVSSTPWAVGTQRLVETALNLLKGLPRKAIRLKEVPFQLGEALPPPAEALPPLPPLEEVEDVELLLAHARALRQEERFEEAVPLLQRAVKVGAENVQAWFLLGLTMAEEIDPSVGVECLREAVRLDRDFADGWFQQARLEDQLGKHGEARASYQHFLETSEAATDVSRRSEAESRIAAILAEAGQSGSGRGGAHATPAPPRPAPPAAPPRAPSPPPPPPQAAPPPAPPPPPPSPPPPPEKVDDGLRPEIFSPDGSLPPTPAPPAGAPPLRAAPPPGPAAVARGVAPPPPARAVPKPIPKPKPQPAPRPSPAPPRPAPQPAAEVQRVKGYLEVTGSRAVTLRPILIGLAVIGLVLVPAFEWLSSRSIELATDLPTELEIRGDHPVIPKIAECLVAAESALSEAGQLPELEGDARTMARYARDSLRKLSEVSISASGLTEYNQRRAKILALKEKGAEPVLRFAMELYAKARKDIGQPVDLWQRRRTLVHALHRLMPATRSFHLEPEDFRSLAEGLDRPPIPDRLAPLQQIGGAWYWQNAIYQEMVARGEAPTPVEALVLCHLVEVTPPEGLPQIEGAVPAAELLGRMPPGQLATACLLHVTGYTNKGEAVQALEQLLEASRDWSQQQRERLLRPLLRIGWNWVTQYLPEKARWTDPFLKEFQDSPYGAPE